VEGEEVGVAFLNDKGAKRQSKGDIVEGIWSFTG
jgi:hypothetical protein